MKVVSCLFICLFIFPVGMFAKDDPVLKTFEKKVDIHCNVSSINSDDLGEVLDFLVFDSIIVVYETHQPYFFKYFNKTTGVKQDVFIRMGNGPNELNTSLGMEKYDENTFISYDVNRKYMVFLKSGDIINKNYKFHDVVNFDNTGLVFFKIYSISGSKYLCTGILGEGAYCIYNPETKENKVSVDFPVEEKHKNEDNIIKSMANQGNIALHPDKNKFVFASGRGYIDFCKVENMNIELVKRNFYFSSDYKVLMEYKATAVTSESVQGFLDVCATDTYIYTLYSGKTMKDAGADYITSNNILVFDWEGNPVVNYKTDRLLRNIKYDEKEEIFYAYSVNQETGLPEILTFELPVQ